MSSPGFRSRSSSRSRSRARSRSYEWDERPHFYSDAAESDDDYSYRSRSGSSDRHYYSRRPPPWQRVRRDSFIDDGSDRSVSPPVNDPLHSDDSRRGPPNNHEVTEMWIIKDARQALEQNWADFKFRFQFRDWGQLPGVSWALQLFPRGECADPDLDRSTLVHFVNYGRYTETRHCWTTVMAALMREVISGEPSSVPADAGLDYVVPRKKACLDGATIESVRRGGNALSAKAAAISARLKSAPSTSSLGSSRRVVIVKPLQNDHSAGERRRGWKRLLRHPSDDSDDSDVVVLGSPQSGMDDDVASAEKPLEVVSKVKLGPNEFIFRSRHASVKCAAWPLDVLRSAIGEDNTIRIRVTLSVCDVAHALRSRDFVRGLSQSKMLADFTIKVGLENIDAHRCVLADASIDAGATFFAEAKEGVLDLTDVAARASVKAFLALIYYDVWPDGSDNETVELIGDVLYLSHRFKTERLKDQVVAVILKCIGFGNVLRILDAAIQWHAPKAKEACFVFLLSNRSRICDSDLLQKLMQKAQESSDVCREFFQLFFGRQLGCSGSCGGGRERPSESLEDSMELLPNAEIELTDTWVISSAESRLDARKLVNTLFDCRRHLRRQGHWAEGLEWKLTLYPYGRISRQTPYPEFASLSLSLGFDGYRASHDRDAYEFCWAFVDVSLEVEEGVSIAAGDSDGRMPIEFSTNNRGLVVERAWLVSTLKNAIRIADDTLHVRVQLRILNVATILYCREMMRSLYEERALSDFELGCGDLKVKVHKCILAQRSEIFARMFSSQMRESAENFLDLTDVTTPAGLDGFVRAIYFEQNTCKSCEDTLEVLKLAHQYGMDDVKNECDRQLVRYVDLENALQILSACKLYVLPLAKATCLRYLKANAAKFLASESWTELTRNDYLRDLLQSFTADLLSGNFCKSCSNK